MIKHDSGGTQTSWELPPTDSSGSREGFGWDFRQLAYSNQATCIVSKWIQVATLPWPSWKWKNVVRFTFYLEKIPILTAMFQAPARYCTGNILFQMLVVGWPSCWRDGVDRDNFSSSYDMVDPTWGPVFSSKSFAAGSLEWFWRWCSQIRNPTFWDKMQLSEVDVRQTIWNQHEQWPCKNNIPLVSCWRNALIISVRVSCAKKTGLVDLCTDFHYHTPNNTGGIFHYRPVWLLYGQSFFPFVLAIFAW